MNGSPSDAPTKETNICYCGNYGGGKHTRSARCPGGEISSVGGNATAVSSADSASSLGKAAASDGVRVSPEADARTSKEESYRNALAAIRQQTRSDPADLETAAGDLRSIYDIANMALFAGDAGFTSPVETDGTDWKARALRAEEVLGHNMALANATTRRTMEERNSIIRKLREKYSAIEIADMVGLTRQRVHQILNEAPLSAVETTCRAGISVKDPTPPQEIVLCAAMGPSGFICERPKGHAGRHRDGDNTPWSSEKASEVLFRCPMCTTKWLASGTSRCPKCKHEVSLASEKASGERCPNCGEELVDGHHKPDPIPPLV